MRTAQRQCARYMVSTAKIKAAAPTQMLLLALPAAWRAAVAAGAFVSTGAVMATRPRSAGSTLRSASAAMSHPAP